MHRQSLGSPASKHHHSLGVIQDNANLPLASPPQPSLLSSPYDEQKKPLKSQVSKPPHKYIHAIPLLTILCFLILYLSSHRPSQSELDQLNGFKKMQDPIGSRDSSIDEMEELTEIKKGGVLGIGSLRNLREIDREGKSKYEQHRKIGDF